MQYDPVRHHRRSIRIQGYDYSRGGAYFVTICAQGRECLLGSVADNVMTANAAGQMVKEVWDELPAFYPGVDLAGFVLMPNHVHGIIVLVGAATLKGAAKACPRGRPSPGQAQGPAPTGTLSLADLVHRFKTMTTRRYAAGVNQMGWPALHGRLWQRNYYEHVIRNDEAFDRIRQYIFENPFRWPSDPENPEMPW